MAEEAVVNELAQATPDVVPDADATAAPADAVAGGESKQADKPAKTFTQEELDAEIGKRIAKAERKSQREADRRVAEAVAKHAIATTKAEDASQEATTKQTSAQHTRASEIDTAYTEVIERGGDKYEDFDAAMFSVSRVPMSDETGLALKEAIAESDEGDELLYYLGKHKDEATAIGKMSPARALVALGKIEAKLPAKTPTAKKTSSAPAPITPVTPGAGSTYTNLDDPRALKVLGTTAWIKARQEKAMQEARDRAKR